MCKDVRNSYIVHKLGIQRVPYDIRNYAVMRVFGKMSWGYYAGLRFPKTGHPVRYKNLRCSSMENGENVMIKILHLKTQNYDLVNSCVLKPIFD